MTYIFITSQLTSLTISSSLRKRIMGRRARTNCSPIDSVLEKYHNDIGNRLSGVFMPTHPTADGDEQLSSDFCMLTLDTRHMSSIRNKPRVPETIVSSENDIHSNLTEDTDVSSFPEDSFTSTTSYRTGMDQENIPKEKKSIMDKLKPALFKNKKHLCSRCNRKSRSCQPNKNFSGTEKHYMCEQCREKLNSLNSLFVEKASSKDSERSAHPAEYSSSSSKNKHLVIPFPRTNINDSGYETVTSCSTVASSYSAFNAPDSSTLNSNANKDNNALKPTHLENPESSSRTNIATPKLNDSTKEKFDASLNTHCVCSNQDKNSSKPAVNKTAGLYQFMGPAPHGSPAGILRQVKQRNNEDYDGYLPEFCEQGCVQGESRTPLGDATNLEGAMRIINISKPPAQLPTQKACYTCESTTKPCFRLPWAGGWICEDCLDKVH